jgi:alpha-1,2-mannosyltransferase
MSDSRPRVAFLRDANWLTAGRATGWCICLAVVSVIALAASILAAPNGVTANGTLRSPDFVTFYDAAWFLHAGDAAKIYDHQAFAGRLQALFPHAKPGDYAFLYPPTILLLCVGLTSLPYAAALALWLAATLLALLAAIRPLLPPRGVLAALTYPAVLINVGNGQNAFVTGALFAAAMAFGGSAPILAGATLGLLAIKPQLALLIPVTLALSGKWRSFAAAGASALALCVISGLLFGFGTWQAWLASSGLSRQILEHGYNGYQNMLSAFAAVRLLHGGVGLAYAVQAMAAAGILVVLIRRLCARTDLRIAIAATAVATLIATPWSLDYDLVILAGPLAWLAREGIITGWRPWEKITLLAAFVLPLLSRNVAADTKLNIAPVILLALLMIVLRRASNPDVVRSKD